MASAGVWKQSLLKDFFWFQEGPGVRKWQFKDAGVKLLNVANIEKSRTLNLDKTDRHLDSDEVRSRYSHFLIDAGDLVIASSGISFDDDGMLRTRGAFVEEQHLPLCLNTSTIRFKARPEMSDLRYLQHWLDSREFREQITRLVTGSAQQNFGPSHLNAIKISLPPLPEQIRIAAILDQADALRVKRREALAQLDSLTQSIFIDMFGDPVANSKGWDMVKLGDHTLKMGSGSTPTGGDAAYKESGISLIRSLNVHDGKFRYKNLAFIDDQQASKLANVKVVEGDVLLNITGASVARVCLAPKDVLPARVNQHVMIIRPKPTIDSAFLEQMLLSPSMKNNLLQIGAGATRESITKAQAEELKVICPPISLQHTFAKRLTSVAGIRAGQAKSLAELDSLFASLQHRAFRGEL